MLAKSTKTSVFRSPDHLLMVKSKELPIERPSRACPASRYLNPRGHMQRDCRRSPNANRLSTRSLPSSPYSITFFHPESNRVAGRSERVCFFEERLRRRLRARGWGLETHSRVSCRLVEPTDRRQQQAFSKGKEGRKADTLSD